MSNGDYEFLRYESVTEHAVARIVFEPARGP